MLYNETNGNCYLIGYCHLQQETPTSVTAIYNKTPRHRLLPPTTRHPDIGYYHLQQDTDIGYCYIEQDNPTSVTITYSKTTTISVPTIYTKTPQQINGQMHSHKRREISIRKR